MASGALINWHKSTSFWVSSKPLPEWIPAKGFQWIPRGSSVRYLGVQVGIDLAPTETVRPLMDLLQKKVVSWSHAHLSLAGRVIIVNQVLLATIWYVASCWLFSRSIMSQIQGLVRNFLWANKYDSRAHAKVAWSVIIFPKSQGGLGIIDLLQQSKAMLVKFIIRGLSLGKAFWKEMLWKRMQDVMRKHGGQWERSVKWFFHQGSVLVSDTIDIF